MKAVVVYESFWGTTAATARAIAQGLGTGTPVLTTEQASPEALSGVDLLVVGAPLLAFALPTEKIREQIAVDPKAPSPADVAHPSMRSWLAGLGKRSGRYAAFETAYQYSPGNAAKTIAEGLKTAGLEPAVKPARFRVDGYYGPLKPGELERATAWGAELAAQMG